MTDKNANTEIRKEFCPNCEEEEYIFSDWYKSLSEHIELFAAAFVKATNLNPREIKMVQKTTSDGMKIWFEPFPDGSEIEMYRSRAELAEKQLAALREQVRWRKYPEEKPEEKGWYQTLEKNSLGLFEDTSYWMGHSWQVTEIDGEILFWIPPLPLPPEEQE